MFIHEEFKKGRLGWDHARFWIARAFSRAYTVSIGADLQHRRWKSNPARDSWPEPVSRRRTETRDGLQARTAADEARIWGRACRKDRTIARWRHGARVACRPPEPDPNTTRLAIDGRRLGQLLVNAIGPGTELVTQIESSLESAP